MTPGINTLLLSTGALGSFTCSGMTLLIYMGPTALRGIRATGDTLSNVESQVFTPYKFGSTAGDRTPDLLTTRPTCYHSATALCMNIPQYCNNLQPYTAKLKYGVGYIMSMNSVSYLCDAFNYKWQRGIIRYLIDIIIHNSIAVTSRHVGHKVLHLHVAYIL